MGNLWTPEKIPLFLEALIEYGGNISEACSRSGMARSTVYKLESEDAQFKAAFREAQRHGLEVLEDEARRRAFSGTEKPIFHQGQQCGAIKEYSDTLMIFLLKGGMPDKYRENWKVDNTSSDGSMTPKAALDIGNLTPDQLLELAKMAFINRP